MIARTPPSETERLLSALERLGPIDAVIAACALLEAEDEYALAMAWAQEVEPIRDRLPAVAIDHLADLLIERVSDCEGVPAE